MKARPVLNVEECDRLSFMPYMFGNDLMPSSGITSPFTRNATPFTPRWTD
ncbi:MAG: hypothetical protein E7L40_13110 [Corynebacterium kroppenstedtii]|nr:hypothetical protein [Corynebacterium kroppenstedtii]